MRKSGNTKHRINWKDTNESPGFMVLDMDIQIVKEKISPEELARLARNGFGDMVKAVVDIERGIMAIGGELHADAEAELLNNGSAQKDLWGINIYPEKSRSEMIQYTSMINIRPAQNNFSREIHISEVREKIRNIFNTLVSV